MTTGLIRKARHGIGLTLGAVILLAAADSPHATMLAPRAVQIAQAPAPPAPAPAYALGQIDQLVAPIALYPDPLLSQILMAATYPLEVVEAWRWVQDPNNARLRGDPLNAALVTQNWDPSVKSLVPFPPILRMMNSRLDWTQALGNAFLAQQSDVMDTVQRLRAQAQAAGTLRSTPQETVASDGGAIEIEPANPDTVYVPYYNPADVYGTWGYPQYPPTYFPPPPGYGNVAGPGIYFGIGFGVVGALWGWDRWDWAHRRIAIDAERFNTINSYVSVHDDRPHFTGNSWQHDAYHRRGVPYGIPALRQQFRPATAQVGRAAPEFRGFAAPASAPAPRAAIAAPSPRPAPAAAPRAAPPAFASYGRGAEVRAQSQRGQASRQTMAPAAAPRGGGGGRPAGGGRR